MYIEQIHGQSTTSLQNQNLEKKGEKVRHECLFGSKKNVAEFFKRFSKSLIFF